MDAKQSRGGNSCYWVGIGYPTVLANDLNKLLKVENSTKPEAVSPGNKSDKEETDKESTGLEADSVLCK